MLINRLHLVNFRQHEDTELVLGTGLTGIVGPNGAGKTTLLEAIAWAMYGMPAARGSRDTIRRRGAPPRAKVEVELDFSLGAHQYHLVRSLQNAELYQDGAGAPIANSLGAVTERVTRLLGMSRDEFFNTYFTGQKELAVMAAMSPTDRAQFLSRVLGYERIRTAQDRLREQRSTLRAKLDALRGSLPDPAALEAEAVRAAERLAAAVAAERSGRAALAAAEAAQAEAAPRWEAMQQLRETATTLETELRIAEERRRVAEATVARTGRQHADAVAARTALEALLPRIGPLAALRAELERLEHAAAAHASRQGQLVQRDEVRRRLAELDARLAALPSGDAIAAGRAKVAELRAELAAAAIDVESRRTSWVQDGQEARTKRQGLLDQYQDLREQRDRIMAAGADGACPTCARPLGAEFETVLGVLDRQLDEVQTNGRFYKARIEQLKDEPPELVAAESRRLAFERELSAATAEEGRLEAQAQEEATLRRERTRVAARAAELDQALGAEPSAYDERRHATVRREVRLLEPLALDAERHRALADRAAALEAEAAAAAAELREAEVLAEALRGRIAQLGYGETAWRAARAAAESAAAARQQAEVTCVRARAEREAAEEAERAVARRREERAAREREAAGAAAELALRQELDRAFTDLRTDLNAALRPDLSELASSFLRDLTNGRYTDLELDENYNATLVDDGDPKAVISGGEEDVANLALRLAISQMIAERAGQPLSLLILDEIFGSLDEDRRQAVVNLLRSLADRFPQVILITHIDTVREGFDRVVRVGLDLTRGVATVRDEPIGGNDVAA
jgi:exonuclease SbcC